MKSLETLYESLGDPCSSCFAGSAALVSLLILLSEASKTVEGFEDGFGGLRETAERLVEEDGELFQLSRKEKLDSEDWSRLSDIVSDYAFFFEKVQSLISLLQETDRKKEGELLFSDYVFLSHTFQSSLSSFYEKEDVPEQFYPVAAYALQAIAGTATEEEA